MQHLLGLIDTMSAMIGAGKRIPFSKNVGMDQDALLEIIHKMRILIKEGGGQAARSIEQMASSDPRNDRMILSKAQQEARRVKEDADRYADETLAHLMASVLKLQRTLDNGRQRLAKMRNEANAMGNEKSGT